MTTKKGGKLPSRLEQYSDPHGLDQESREQIQRTLLTITSAHERISTKWVVVTGAPGSGKTTLLSQLGSSGRRVIDDPAREVLEDNARLTASTGRKDYARIQETILRQMMETARQTSPTEKIFFDYALPDNLAFLKVANLQWTAMHVRAACQYKYEHVFVLENPNVMEEMNFDSIRTETIEQRQSIYHLLVEIYALLGIATTRIPWTSVPERLGMLNTALRSG